jgi:hypothetical protein
LNNFKADLQFFYCNFYIGLYKAIKCKPYSEITVESGTQLKTAYLQCRLTTKVPDYKLALCRLLDILKRNFCFMKQKFSQP